MKRPSSQSMRAPVAGFSLIELMVVVVILGILAATAVSMYHQYVLRGHRTSATRALQDLAGRQENYYYEKNTYTSSLSDLAASSSIAGTFYTVSIASASSTDYTLEADAQSTQTQDTNCASFTLTRAGVQGSNGSTTTDANNCWQSH